jgi:hypothetical protein
MTVVNNQETNEGDKVFYVDDDKQIHDAVIESIYEKDGNHFAELKVDKDGKHSNVPDVPHNTSTSPHSWNHPMSAKERKTHYHPHFYGIPESEETEE